MKKILLGLAIAISIKAREELPSVNYVVPTPKEGWRTKHCGKLSKKARRAVR